MNKAGQLTVRTQAVMFLLICGLTFVQASRVAWAETGVPDLHAHSAILLDFSTGEILYEKNADQLRSPASLTKLMTLHLTYRAMALGRTSPEDQVALGRECWASSFDRPSSLMFLGPDQDVTVEELMRGTAVVSGNDAATALARHIAGNVESFVELMNLEAKRMGYKNMRFVDPSGLSPDNLVTAREFGDFCRWYVLLHPNALESFHSVQKLTYPKPENIKPGNPLVKGVTQRNKNPFLGEYKGVDGLKTGYLRITGNNIALTAKRGDVRLIAVILGVEPKGQGRKRLSHDGTALLDYGFLMLDRPEVAEAGGSE